MHTARDTVRTRADNSPIQHTRSPPRQRRRQLPLSWAELLNALDQTDTVIRNVLVLERLSKKARADLERIMREVSGPTLGRAGRRMVDPAPRQLPVATGHGAPMRRQLPVAKAAVVWGAGSSGTESAFGRAHPRPVTRGDDRCVPPGGARGSARGGS
jgi:hypothetical protein